MKSGNPAQAIAEWREALKLQPDSIEALANLAWVLATAKDDQLRNGAEAVALAERAGSVRAAKMLPPVFDPLAAAYAETGRYADAANILLRAIALAEATGQTNALIKYQRHVELYRRGLPWRE
jgi:tetratricopeptide (TPR) repeat protein